MTDTWSYRDESWTTGGDFIGYDVEATDGSIGKIDAKSDETSSSYVVVDTGFWIFGKKRLIPAGAVIAVDHENQKVQVALTKDEIKDAPDYDESSFDDSARTSHGEYYSRYNQS